MKHLIIFAVAFLGSWEPIPIPADEESIEAWHRQQTWTCSTDTECLEQCRGFAEAQGIDTAICSDENAYSTKGE